VSAAASKSVPEAVPVEAANVKLSPADKKALREQARREFRTAERERLEAEAAAKAGGAPKPAAATSTPAPGTPAAAAAPERKPDDSTRDCAVFLRGVLMPLVALLARPFGFTLDLAAFTEAKAAEDAKAWLPLLRLYPAVDRAIAWVSAPARLVARVRELAKPREPKEPTP
jgi:hypothetical protein